MSLRHTCFALAAIWIQQGIAQESPGKNYRDIPKSDCHVHLVDFLQNGEFWSARENAFIPPSPRSTLSHGKRGLRIVSLLKRMEAARVEHAMVSGMPFVKKWASSDPIRSRYYLDSSSRVVRARDTDYTVALSIMDFLESDFPNAQKERLKLYPFVSGFDSTDMGAVDMIVKRIKEFPGLWEGIGEVMSRHDDLTNLTTGERPTANHPALHRIAKFAGSVHLPLSIHHNIAPVSPSGRAKEPLYLHEIEELFDTHPEANLIWCHAGISRRVVVENLPKTLRDVLSKPGRSKHVFIDLSWVVYEKYIYHDGEKPGTFHVDNRKQWASLISDFPSNFMIGSDVVAKFDGYAKEINKFAPLFETLGTHEGGNSLVRKVAHDNFWKLMELLRKGRGGKGVVLPEDFQFSEHHFTRKRSAGD